MGHYLNILKILIEKTILTEASSSNISMSFILETSRLTRLGIYVRRALKSQLSNGIAIIQIERC